MVNSIFCKLNFANLIQLYRKTPLKTIITLPLNCFYMSVLSIFMLQKSIAKNLFSFANKQRRTYKGRALIETTDVFAFCVPDKSCAFHIVILKNSHSFLVIKWNGALLPVTTRPSFTLVSRNALGSKAYIWALVSRRSRWLVLLEIMLIRV